MIDRSQIVNIIITALHNLNQEFEESERFQVHENMVLFGCESALDSMGLVSLVMDVELVLSEQYGVEVDLADERAMSMKNSPFRTVQSLADYIYTLVVEQNA